MRSVCITREHKTAIVKLLWVLNFLWVFNGSKVLLTLRACCVCCYHRWTTLGRWTFKDNSWATNLKKKSKWMKLTVDDARHDVKVVIDWREFAFKSMFWRNTVWCSARCSAPPWKHEPMFRCSTDLKLISTIFSFSWTESKRKVDNFDLLYVYRMKIDFVSVSQMNCKVNQRMKVSVQCLASIIKIL